MKKTGLALGGGGARGFAHLGAVKALREKGIQPDIFSGTSAGSIVAALLAAGKSPDEAMAFMQDIKLTDAAQCERIIAIDISPVQGIQKVDNLSDIMIQVFQMSIGMQTDCEADCDLLIRMEELADFGILDTGHNQEIYNIGYEHVSKLNVPPIGW